MTLLASALAYAAEGRRIFPITPGAKTPACKNGVLDATTDAARIRTWWTAMPDAGIGLACGGGILVLDIDGEIGAASLVAVARTLGPLTTDLLCATPHGAHLYFTLPDDPAVKNSASKLGPGLDVRTVGGYVILPPTPGYCWEAEGTPAPLPAAWLARLRELGAPPKVQPAPCVDPGATSEAVRVTKYALAALQKEAEKVRTAPVGQRNVALNNAALAMGHLVAGGQIHEADVRIALTDAATVAGLKEAETQKTLTSGIQAGRLEPKYPEKVIAMKAAGPRRASGALALAKPAPDPDEPWKAELATDQFGRPKSTAANATILLSESPSWRGALGWDAFSLRALWLRVPRPDLAGAPAVGDAFTDVHVIWAQRALQAEFGCAFGKDALWNSLLCAAWAFRSHAVRDWLHAIVWDGVPRVGWWLSTYLGAESTEYTRGVGQKFLISAVARIEQPGCQVDHMLVLEARQGAGKSSAVRILAGNTYLGSLPDLRDRKGAAEVLQARWICEVGELDALRGAASGRVKDFISQTTDYFRPAYMRVAAEYPRQVCFIGTTNEGQYLSDATGARRYWPVACVALDRARLVADRDQIWAEALALYRRGAPWWGDEQAEHLARDEQEQRFTADEWEPVVARWLQDGSGGSEITTGRVLEGALRMEPGTWDRASQIRVGYILSRLGYRMTRVQRDGVRLRTYILSDEAAQ